MRLRHSIYGFSTIMLLTLAFLQAHAQKILSEGTVTYDVFVQTGSDQPKLADMFDGATATLFLRGALSRFELSSALGKSITIHDTRNGNGALLREYGAQKLLIRMNRASWEDRNKKYEGLKVTETNETKDVAGYPCRKAIINLKDGTSFVVFYTNEIKAEYMDTDAQFNRLPGFPMEYETTLGKLKVKYTVSRIAFDPVPVQRFDLPTAGYREMTYEESLKTTSKNSLN